MHGNGDMMIDILLNNDMPRMNKTIVCFYLMNMLLHIIYVIKQIKYNRKFNDGLQIIEPLNSSSFVIRIRKYRNNGVFEKF